jgi:NitT/TauT family transport system permease protein
MDTRSFKTTELYRFYLRYRYIVLGLITMIVCWQLMSMWISPIIVASPADTFVSLWKLIQTAETWEHLGTSLMRMILGILLGSLIGGAIGILSGLKPRWQAFLEPLRWGVMTMPSIITLVLVLLFFGIGGQQVIIMTAFVTFPFAYVNTVEAIKSVDRKLIEMAEIYKIPRHLRVLNIYLPGIGSSIMAGLTLTTGMGVRAAILAEFMGAREGIGHNLFLSWTHLNTPDLYSWIMLTFIVLGILEFGVLRPVRNYVLRWQRVR